MLTLCNDVAMRYRPELDGIRALAVLAVIASHSYVPLSGGGWMGVDVFFVLSGYLITSLLLAEHDRSGGIALGKFYTRRALRLYPALLVMLLAGLPFFRVLGDGGTLAGYDRGMLSAGLYIEDFVEGVTGGSWDGVGHTWSLAVEEQFYLIWPIALILLINRRMRLLTWTGVASGVSFVILILTIEHVLPGDAYYLPWARFSTLLVGCCLAIVLHRGHRPKVVQKLWFGGVAVAAVVGLFIAGSYFGRETNLTWEAPAIAFATAAVVWHLSSSSSVFGVLLAWKPLVWLGRRSYGVYLYHFPILIILGAYLTARRSVLTLMVVVLTIIVAAISYRFVELPFLRLKSRLSAVTTSSTRSAAVDPTTLGDASDSVSEAETGTSPDPTGPVPGPAPTP
jgi:peptidoglycan/LPS O-acetylase OafA/YrhL